MRGSCLCGDVKFRVEGPVRDASYCHCVQCRKMSGHYWACLSTDQDSLILEHGEQSLAWFPAKRHESGFCVICGTTLFWRLEDADTVSVSLGAFDEPIGIRPTTHIYTDEQGDYYDLPPGAVAHPRDEP